jgi:hypothetical protein
LEWIARLRGGLRGLLVAWGWMVLWQLGFYSDVCSVRWGR